MRRSSCALRSDTSSETTKQTSFFLRASTLRLLMAQEATCEAVVPSFWQAARTSVFSA